MKIQLLSDPEKTAFSQIHAGVVFRFNGQYYIKVSHETESKNTFSVYSNCLTNFGPFILVEPKNFILQEVNP